nr:thioredoxin domain-containing protein [Sedimentibacter sp.]
MIEVNKKNNKLINEKSPYLLQHAYNPVDWYPWGEEAFNKAKSEDKPIFLSIGYSTCHWCHVMAHESFEDDEVADALNRDFVCIKVDREERPDIDSVYMSVAQRLTGSGGWPLTIIMTAEQQPFFAGTYFPKQSRYGIKGILEILNIVKAKWENDKDEIIKSSSYITDTIKEQEHINSGKKELSETIIASAKEIFRKSFDKKYGGFGKSPKFPQPSNIMFLMKYYKLEKDEKVLEMVEKTLEGMYRGGIFDHVGFGFSRYSTDDKWLVPHFEKMLYDNAGLVICYIEAYQLTRKALYKNVATKTLDYILREMTDKAGGFFSAQDADSEGEEGKYYVFEPDEIIQVLGEDDGKYFNDYFNITKRGNFEGKNIPNLINNENYYETNKNIEMMIEKIYDYRFTRTKLHKDDKILTSWNGMMIAAFARAYKVFGLEKYLHAAENALRFIKKNLIDEDNRIGVRYRDGSILENGTLDDYAFYIWALIEMYEATYEIHYLKRAVKFNDKMIKLFWDSENGGFFLTSKDSESLIYRPKEVYDGAMASGNSVASLNLIKLSRLTGDVNLEEISRKQIDFFANIVSDYPSGYTFALLSIMYELYPSKEVICILKNKNNINELNNIIKNKYLTNTVVLAVDRTEFDEVEKVIGFIKNYNLKDDKSTYYVCVNRECTLPITNISELEKNLL